MSAIIFDVPALRELLNKLQEHHGQVLGAFVDLVCRLAKWLNVREILLVRQLEELYYAWISRSRHLFQRIRGSLYLGGARVWVRRPDAERLSE